MTRWPRIPLVVARRRASGLALAPLALLLAAACNGDDGDTRGEGSSISATGVSSASATVTVSTTAGSMSASAGSSSDGGSGTGDASSGTSGGLTMSTSDGSSTGESSGDVTTGDVTATTTTTTTTGDTTDSGGTTTGGGECKTLLQMKIRDFQSSHPDFESYTGDTAYVGLVKEDLGNDNKPVYANAGPTPQTSGPTYFAQWYNDVPDVNLPFEFEIELTESMPGIYTYNNSAFYPIDGQGWGQEGWPHNYLFTTEIHATFQYKGGEVFTFTGDDDLWAFINGKLAIDLGGLHPPLSKSVDLDQMAGYLGITKGGTFAMDIFHAERHTDQSNFRIDTTIQCFIPQ